MGWVACMVCSWCYKTFFGGNLDYPKIKKLKKFILIAEPAEKCEKCYFQAKL